MKNNSRPTSKPKAGKTRDWEKAPGLEAPLEGPGWDDRLSFTSNDVLEALGNNASHAEVGGDFFSRQGYAHLKDIQIDLGGLDLTDRQLMAVSLVFYGGLKKKRAARAMQISSQALTDHLVAGLKKIGRSLQS